jgi:DNA segregation ATPase FtsK/SpoIIIE, S-DNA-T family
MSHSVYTYSRVHPSPEITEAEPSSEVRGEVKLIVGAAVLVAWLLVLVSYSPADPAWTTSGQSGASVHNWLGRLGALAADVSYFLLGFSVWWCWIAGARRWLAGVARWLGDADGRLMGGRLLRNAELRWWLPALLLVLLSSAVTEWTRYYTLESVLPGHAGGLLGYLLGPFALKWLGATGSALVSIALMLVALPALFGFSWMRWSERLGEWLELLVLGLHRRREHARDAEMGHQAVIARDAEVAEERVEHPAAVVERKAEKADKADKPEKSSLSLVRQDPVWDAGWAEPAAALAHAAVPLPSALGAELARFAGDAPARPLAADEPARITSLMGADSTSLEVQASLLCAPLPDVPVPVPVQEADAADLLPVVEPLVVQFAKAHPPVTDSASAGRDGRTGGVGVLARPLAHVVMVEPALAELAPSARVVKERQKPLFQEMPDSPLPQVSLLDVPPVVQETVTMDTLEMTSRLIEKKLKDFGVEVKVVAAAPGPVITRYEIEPATGVKGSQVVNLAKDLARSLSLVSIRVVETIPGKNYMALELPNAKRQTIRLSEILGSQVYHEAKSMLTMGLGKDIVGNPVVADLAKMPHVLVAGTTGSGKSVGINGMILSLLYKAEAKDVRVLMIDPKMLEMSVYEGIPHLLAPVVTDMRQAAHGLNWCVAEMERRYKLMSKLGVRNLAGYNAKIDDARAREEIIGNPFSLTPESPEPLDRLPHIVVVIDELADLMMVVGKKIEELIARLAQKARAAGIHLILATQRPSVDVITGLIKANIPTRIAFQVSSKIDSRTILDEMGAEALLGMGDMLFKQSGTGIPVRVHGAFVSDEEVHRVVNYLKSLGEPDYIEGVLDAQPTDGDDLILGGDATGGGEKDPMYDMAVEVVLKDRKASISYVQRKLKIGYNRAARLLEDMEKAGLVSTLSSSGQRDILVAARPE